jgi:hypothetical protein
LIDGQTKSTYITKHIIPKPNQLDISADRINYRNLDTVERDDTFKFESFFEAASIEFNRELADRTTGDVSYTLYIAEGKHHECPKLVIKIIDQEVHALIDTGCELSIMNEHLYNKLRHEGLECFELPTQHVNLLSPFNKKSNRVKKQAMLGLNIGDFEINQIMLLSPQLLTDAILGLDFLVDYKATIDFAERSITLQINNEAVKIEFIGIKETNALDEKSSEDQFLSFGLVPSIPQNITSSTADQSQCPTRTVITERSDTLARDAERPAKGRKEYKGQHVINREDLVVPRQKGNRDDYVEFTSKVDNRYRELYRKANPRAQDMKSHSVANSSATGHEINKECNEIVRADDKGSLCCTATCSITNDVCKQHAQGLKTGHINDDRMMTQEQLCGKVRENNNLSSRQQVELYKVLSKYQQNLTKRPGRCTKFEYEFKIEGSVPNSANSRPIPFALRNQVRDQIQIMLKDGVIEESYSAYINPLTFVVREAKPLGICVDARRINRQVTADRTKVLPLSELIQKFNSASYITSLDLSSAFLQVPLTETSRKWTTFQFQGKVYQFKVVPYGFKNSLSAFIRALEKVLGDDEINDNLVMYVDRLVNSLTLLGQLQPRWKITNGL